MSEPRVQAKCLFTEDAALAIWSLLRNPLHQKLAMSPPKALILLLTFFPHKTASAVDSKVNWHGIAGEAVATWLNFKLRPSWDRMWLCFLSRLAKWDTHVSFRFLRVHMYGLSKRTAVVVQSQPLMTLLLRYMLISGTLSIQNSMLQRSLESVLLTYRGESNGVSFCVPYAIIA